MANTPQAFVPNLNLDDPTRGVIAELRSSCVKLSGAVDALEQGLERRVENLRTETLQAINDEGGLIRAHFSNVWAESQNSRELKSYTNQSGSQLTCPICLDHMPRTTTSVTTSHASDGPEGGSGAPNVTADVIQINPILLGCGTMHYYNGNHADHASAVGWVTVTTVNTGRSDIKCTVLQFNYWPGVNYSYSSDCSVTATSQSCYSAYYSCLQ